MKLFRPLAAKLLEHLLQLAAQQFDGVVWALCSKCRHPVHEGPSHEGELGPARQRAGNVWARSQSAIEHDGDLLGVHGAEHPVERANRLLSGVDLTPSVVRNNESVKAQCRR